MEISNLFFFNRNKHFPINKNLMDTLSIVDIFLKGLLKQI